jgi:hypothetical protein
MKKLYTTVLAATLAAAFAAGAFGAVTRLQGKVFFHDSEPAPCCLVTLRYNSDCTGGFLGSTATDSCGNYTFDYNFQSNHTYGVKAEFRVMECAAWWYHGTCPDTTKCDQVFIDPDYPGNTVYHDMYLGLENCYNDGCD